jgi:hypothetical protein
MLPWLGDPYTIPLRHIAARYEEACRVLIWKLGLEDNAGIAEDRAHKREVARLRREAQKRGWKLHGG